MNTSLYIYKYTYIYINIYLSISIYIYLNLCIYLSLSLSLSLCVYIYMYTYVCSLRCRDYRSLPTTGVPSEHTSKVPSPSQPISARAIRPISSAGTWHHVT